MGSNTRGSKVDTSKPDMAFLEAQEKALRSLRAHLARRTEKVEGDLARAEGSSDTEVGQQASPRENDEVLTDLSDEGRDQLALVDGALARIADGTYGDCTECGSGIARARLEALPYASTCLGCANEAPPRPR
jgi:RNA polymerase-binding transcription factor DksA